MLYWVHLTWAGFKLTTLVAIGTDCIGSYKSNYHMITTTTALKYRCMVCYKWKAQGLYMWDPIPGVYRIALTVMREISKMALKLLWYVDWSLHKFKHQGLWFLALVVQSLKWTAIRFFFFNFERTRNVNATAWSSIVIWRSKFVLINDPVSIEWES